MERREAQFNAGEIVKIPIGKLHGIPVYIRIEQKYLKIESKQFMSEYLQDNCILFIKQVKSVREAMDILKNLKLHQKYGRFGLDEPMDYSFWEEEFKDCEHIEMEGDMCCVCHTPYIISKTNCGHTLCITCAHQIKEIKDEDDNEITEIPCPMCREDIKYGMDF